MLEQLFQSIIVALDIAWFVGVIFFGVIMLLITFKDTLKELMMVILGFILLVIYVFLTI